VARIAPDLRGPGADASCAWLSQHDVVLRSALQRCLERGRPDVAADLLWTLRFWFDGDPPAWLAVWLRGALQHPSIDSDPAAKARLSILLGFQPARNNYARGADEVKRGLSLLTTPESATTRMEAFDLLQRVIHDLLPDLTHEADRYAAEADRQDSVVLAHALTGRGRRKLGMGRLEEAVADLKRALDLARVDPRDKRFLRVYLGAAQILEGRLAEALQTLENCLAEEAGLDSPLRPLPYAYAALGRIHQRLDDGHKAAAAYGESLKRARAVGSLFPLPLILDGTAWLASKEGRNTLAAQFLGAAEMQGLSGDSHSFFDSLRDREDLTLHLRARLGFHRFFTLYEEGRRMPLESVVAAAAAEIERHVSSGDQTPEITRSPSP
jgi:tetratricopeptide (TPR) repeat protein